MSEYDLPKTTYRVYPPAGHDRNIYESANSVRSAVAQRKRLKGWRDRVRVFKARTVWEDVTAEFVKP